MKSSMQAQVEQTEDPPAETPMVNGLVASQFILKLRETFLSQEAHQDLWSNEFTNSSSNNRNALIAADIASAFRSVFMRNEEGAAPEPGGEGSAARRMKALLDGEASAWPDDVEAFPVPEPFDHDKFRRYEVGCAVAVLMEAFHNNGAGAGGASDFPPTKPD
jgi:hypothetical protein